MEVLISCLLLKENKIDERNKSFKWKPIVETVFDITEEWEATENIVVFAQIILCKY